MRKCGALAIGGVLLISLATPVNAAAPKAGATCTKKNATATSAGKLYTCIKFGKNLVWSKGVKVAVPTPTPSLSPTPSPSPTPSVFPTLKPSPTPTPSSTPSPIKLVNRFGFSNMCETDLQIPSELIPIQNWSSDFNNLNCALTYRFMAVTPSSVLPKTSIPSTQQIEKSSCKFGLNSTGGKPNTGFGRSADLYTPTKSAHIQVVPVQFSDKSASSYPAEDYRAYLDFYVDYLKSISDVPINPVVNVYSSYIQLGKTMASYDLGIGEWSSKSSQSFISDVAKTADPFIDFSGVDQVIIVGPPNANGTELTYHMWGSQPPWITNEGRVKSVYQMGSISLSKRIGSTWSTDPWVLIHEALGHQMGLQDSPDIEWPVGSGVGNWMASGGWDNMGGAVGGFLMWNRWVTGFVEDSEIICAKPKEATNYLIHPEAESGVAQKALIIPLSESSGIVLESKRSIGFNYKYPDNSEGLLAYIVDINRGADPIIVQIPERIDTSKNVIEHRLVNATLKLGEFLIIEGYRISVIEAGDFGDVVKVEKVS